MGSVYQKDLTWREVYVSSDSGWEGSRSLTVFISEDQSVDLFTQACIKL